VVKASGVGGVRRFLAAAGVVLVGVVSLAPPAGADSTSATLPATFGGGVAAEGFLMLGIGLVLGITFGLIGRLWSA
jgi:hypothetical protein